MTYLVMESATSYAVLLDENGRFVKSANLGYEIGDTVTNPVLMLDTPLEKINGRSKVMNRVIATVVAIAAMVLLVFGVNYYQQSVTPYSSIFMAINPEVEMVLNKSGDVIDMNGINADGRTLLEKYKQTSKDKSVIANEIVNRAIEMGYLADGGRVSIAIDTPDQALFEQYGAELRRVFESRDSITFSITDMDNRNQEPEDTPAPEIEAEVEPEVEAVPEDDSGYDESSYGEPVVEQPVEPETPAPSAPMPSAPTTPVQEERPAPTPTIPAPPKPVTPAPKPNPAPEEPVKPAPNPNPAPRPPKDKSDYDTDYDSDYEDTDYDSDYDDSDYDDNRRPNKGKRDKNSYKRNDRNKNGRSNEQNSRNSR